MTSSRMSAPNRVVMCNLVNTLTLFMCNFIKNKQTHTHGIGEGGGEAETRNKQHKSCRRDVGNEGDMGFLYLSHGR